MLVCLFLCWFTLLHFCLVCHTSFSSLSPCCIIMFQRYNVILMLSFGSLAYSVLYMVFTHFMFVFVWIIILSCHILLFCNVLMPASTTYNTFCVVVSYIVFFVLITCCFIDNISVLCLVILVLHSTNALGCLAILVCIHLLLFSYILLFVFINYNTVMFLLLYPLLYQL